MIEINDASALTASPDLCPARLLGDEAKSNPPAVEASLSPDVVERVAIAIYNCNIDDGWTWKTDVQPNRDKCLREAKAAIAAMKEGV